MPNFKLVISHGSKSWQTEKDQKECPLLGKRIGETVDGTSFGLDGYTLEVTGGSDKDGFPMRKDVEGIVRRQIVLEGGVGYKPKYRGTRRRKTIRGNTVAPEIVQINLKVSKQGTKTLEELFGKKEKSEKTEEEKK